MRTQSRSDGPATTDAASTPPSTNLPRRRFLLSLGASGAGAATTALAALPAMTAEVPAAAPATKAGTGYRETEHVRDYYRSAKL
jgi:hypothetical protein